MYEKTIIFWLMVLVSISLVYGAEPYIKSPINEELNLKVPCSLDGGSCASTTECNITIIWPNTSTFINKATMTLNNDTFNYTYPNTYITGDYINYVVCCDGAICDKETFIVRITGGFRINECPDTTPGLLAIFLVTGLLLVFMFIGYVFRHPILGVFSCLGMFVLSWTIYGCQAIIGGIVMIMSLIVFLLFVFRTRS